MDLLLFHVYYGPKSQVAEENTKFICKFCKGLSHMCCALTGCWWTEGARTFTLWANQSNGRMLTSFGYSQYWKLWGWYQTCFKGICIFILWQWLPRAAAVTLVCQCFINLILHFHNMFVFLFGFIWINEYWWALFEWSNSHVQLLVMIIILSHQ